MKAKKNNVALTRTSAFREDRKNYLTEDGYTYWRWDEDLIKEVPAHSMSATPTRCSLTDLLVMSVPARAVRMW